VRTVAVSEVAEVFNGKTPSKAEQRAAGHPVLKVKDLTALGGFTGRFDSFVDAELAQKHRAKWARPGDTVILNAAHNASHVASKAALLSADVEGALLTGEWLVVRPDESTVDHRYVHYWLTCPSVRTALKSAVKGIHLYPRDVASLQIPLPSFHEQRRVSAILDHADALRAKRRRVLTHLDALTHSIFNDMFADARATSTVEAEASLIRTGPFGSQLLHSEFVEQGIAVLGLDNVVGNEFRWGERRFITPAKYEKLKRYTVSPGDVLISIMGTTGRCVVVPDDIPTAINTKHICAITPDSTHLDSTFLRAAFLWHPQSRAHLRRQTKGSIMDGLNMGIIKAMPIPVPPLSEQREFAERARQVIAVRDRATSAGSADDELFASLQSRAFRGEL
jgi:type I restriction enzyme S subunit